MKKQKLNPSKTITVTNKNIDSLTGKCFVIKEFAAHEYIDEDISRPFDFNEVIKIHSKGDSNNFIAIPVSSEEQPTNHSFHSAIVYFMYGMKIQLVKDPQKTFRHQLTQENLVKKWIDDMIKNGFMSGWGGDKSKKFKQEQYNSMMKVLSGDIKEIGGNHRLLATIYSDYNNLKRYCNWTEQDLKQLITLFGFKEISEVLAVMGSEDINAYMDKCKLKPGVQFRLIPHLNY